MKLQAIVIVAFVTLALASGAPKKGKKETDGKKEKKMMAMKKGEVNMVKMDMEKCVRVMLLDAVHIQIFIMKVFIVMVAYFS